MYGGVTSSSSVLSSQQGWLQPLGLTRLVFGTAGDFRLFPTMPPIVDIDGIITVEDVMQELIGEEMPTDACQFYYECANCRAVLRPLNDDCCVFCSYADTVCPPKQSEAMSQC